MNSLNEFTLSFKGKAARNMVWLVVFLWKRSLSNDSSFNKAKIISFRNFHPRNKWVFFKIFEHQKFIQGIHFE